MKIRLQDVAKTYRDADRELGVIAGLSFEFPEKSAIAVVGPSGIGKSTLLHLIGGLDAPSAGKIFFDQTEISALGSDQLSDLRAAKVGFIFQFHHLLPEFNALENVAMPLIIRGEHASAYAKAEQILERVGLRERLTHRPSQLSGGEQQRVAVARAVVGAPAVVLADEPTGNLDQRSAELVQELLLGLVREMDTVLIVVTHSRELAAKMDRTLEMQPGGELLAHLSR